MLSKTFVILFICCFTDIQGSGDREGFPGYVYYPEHNGWLKLHKEPADWQEARITCHLEEALFAANWNSDIWTTINEIQTTEDQSLDVLYAGAEVTMTISDDGVYRYLEGEPTLSADPGGLKVPCVVFYANGTMGEVNCKQRLPYVCYTPANACGQNNLGYKFDNRTEHCYKFHTHAVNWTDAYKACGGEGGYLAVINGDTEAELLKQLFEKYPASVLTGTNLDNVVSIGFYYWKLSNSWWTIHGQTLEQTGYAKWRPGEPSIERDPTTRYAALHRDGTLYSMYPHRKVPFICEKNPAVLLLVTEPSK